LLPKNRSIAYEVNRKSVRDVDIGR
jgi:hypothetical protein